MLSLSIRKKFIIFEVSSRELWKYWKNAFIRRSRRSMYWCSAVSLFVSYCFGNRDDSFGFIPAIPYLIPYLMGSAISLLHYCITITNSINIVITDSWDQLPAIGVVSVVVLAFKFSTTFPRNLNQYNCLSVSLASIAWIRQNSGKLQVRVRHTYTNTEVRSGLSIHCSVWLGTSFDSISNSCHLLSLSKHINLSFGSNYCHN